VEEEEVSESRRGCWFVGIALLFALFFLYLFRAELELIFTVGILPFQMLRGIISADPFVRSPTASEIIPLIYLGVNAFLLYFFTLWILFMLAQFALPAPTVHDRWPVVARILDFIFDRASSVFPIKEGKSLRELNQDTDTSRGVAIVDLDSAIIIERKWSPLSQEGMSQSIGVLGPQKHAIPGFPWSRMGGPGLVFIGRDERLRGIVSLRKQIRISQEIRAYTSDGIEMSCNVFAIFTLGQPPTNIKVAYHSSDLSPENISLVQVDSNNTVTKIVDDLDIADKREIHAYAQRFIASRERSEPLKPAETGSEIPPFIRDPVRIANAIYTQGPSLVSSKGQIHEDSRRDEWTDVPAKVGGGILRNMLGQVKYDTLYSLDNLKEYHLLEKFRPAFIQRLKYQGVLSYQFIFRRGGLPPNIGDRIETPVYRISPLQPLRNSKPLRDRGIKVIHAGIVRLKPADPAVMQQRFENWRARWQQEAETIKSEGELEVLRIISQARAEKQREMILKLSSVLKMSNYPEEAVILRIFQALEDAASDPGTRQLLPHDTINFLRSLRLWVLADEKMPRMALGDSSEKSGGE
jgi:hypothetical protein